MMQDVSVSRSGRRRERSDQSDSADYSDADASYEEDNINNSNDEDEESEYDSVEQSGSSDLSERESGDGQAAPGLQKNEKVDHDEDRRNPQYIPKRGTFYEHDDRTAPGDEEGEGTESKEPKGTSTGGDVIITSGVGREKIGAGTPGSGPERKQRQSRANTADKWTHDKFNENDQAPKSSDELVSIYGYDIRAEEGPPRAFRRRKYGRGPNKYTRNWEDEQAYNAKLTPQPRTKPPPQVTNGEEFPTLQSTNDRSKGERRRNGHKLPKKPIEVVPVKKQQPSAMDKNANKTQISARLNVSSDHHSNEAVTPKQDTVEKAAITPKQRSGRVLAAPGPLRRPYAETKEVTHPTSQKDTSTPIQKNSVPPSAGLPSASLGGTQEKKSPTTKKPTATSSLPPRMQHPGQPSSTPQSMQPVVIPSQQPIPSAVSAANNNAISQSRASPPQQLPNVQAQTTTQVTEVAAGRGKRYSSIRQRPMPDQYQPVQYITDYQPSAQQAQSAQTQQPLSATMAALPHRQTPPPLQQTQQQLLSQQSQQLLQTQQLQQSIHQKTPPPQLHPQGSMHQQQILQSSQGIHQPNPNIIQSTQHTQSIPQSLHQMNPPMQQIHQASPTLHQASPTLHQVSPTLHQTSTSVLQSNAALLQSNPQMLQPSPPIHQASAPIHQPNPTMLQTTTGLHPPTQQIIQNQQIHQQSTTIHQTSPSLHQPSPTLHQTNLPIHQNSQPILQNNPPMHQVSPPLQTQMGRQGSAPAVSTLPIRQVQRTHQQVPIHNMPAPTHIQNAIPQQNMVATQSYPAQPVLPQTQYIQNSSSNIYSHSIPPPVYQAQPAYPAPPPPMPYHHQPAPTFPARSTYREPSGITFYSPLEQKGLLAPPPSRRPTNPIPIVPPPSRRDRERQIDAAALQKDNIDHIVDNMFVPRHQQPRNAPPRPGDTSRMIEPLLQQAEFVVEEKTKDGSGDNSSKEASVEPVMISSVTTDLPLYVENEQLISDFQDNRVLVETLVNNDVEEKPFEATAEIEQQEQEEKAVENVECLPRDSRENSELDLPAVDVTQVAEEVNVPSIETEQSDAAILSESATNESQVDEVITALSVEVKDIALTEESSGVQDIPSTDVETAVVEEAEPIVEEEKTSEPPVDNPVEEIVEKVEVSEETVEKLSAETNE